MNVRTSFVRIVMMSLLVSTIASVVDAQILPRNRRRANTNQRIQPQPNVERNSTEGTATDQTRERTQVDTSVSRDANTQTNVNVLRSTQLVGSMVNIRGQERFGRVTEVILNDSGCVSFIVVDIDGRMAPIPWHMGRFDYQARSFVLEDFDQARLARIPTFTNFGQFSNQTFVTEVNQFFGVQANTDVNLRGNNARRSTNINGEAPRAAREGDQDQDKATEQDRDPQSDRQPREATGQPTRTNEDTGNQANPSEKSDAAKDEEPKQPSSPDQEPAPSTTPEKQSEPAPSATP